VSIQFAIFRIFYSTGEFIFGKVELKRQEGSLKEFLYVLSALRFVCMLRWDRVATLVLVSCDTLRWLITVFRTKR